MLFDKNTTQFENVNPNEYQTLHQPSNVIDILLEFPVVSVDGKSDPMML
jgi:hypothetical protein